MDRHVLSVACVVAVLARLRPRYGSSSGSGSANEHVPNPAFCLLCWFSKTGTGIFLSARWCGVSTLCVGKHGPWYSGHLTIKIAWNGRGSSGEGLRMFGHGYTKLTIPGSEQAKSCKSRIRRSQMTDFEKRWCEELRKESRVTPKELMLPDRVELVC